MKKKNNRVNKQATKKQYDKGQVFVKVMAGVLAILTLGGTGMTLIYALIG